MAEIDGFYPQRETYDTRSLLWQGDLSGRCYAGVMEFSYRVSEADFRSAWTLGRKGSARAGLRPIMFWVFILICLMMLWAVVSRPGNQTGDSQDTVITQQQSPPGSGGSAAKNFFLGVGPYIFFLGLWFVFLFTLVPRQLRRAYRNDPTMQGQFTVTVEPTSITIRNTAGTLYEAGWNLYESWREKQDVIVLNFKTAAYTILVLTDLSDFQRNELRSILTTALPKK